MSTVGVVLAGGKSSRMGEDKALLKLSNGKTLLQQSIHLLESINLEKVIISGNRENGLSDQIEDQGPLAAIETIIHKTQANKILFIPVDMPLLTKQLLLQLMTSTKTQYSCYFQNHYLPLSLVVTQKTKTIIRHLLEPQDKKQRSIKNLLKQIPTKILTIKDSQDFCLQNINTPEQWQQLKKVELKDVS